MRKTNEEPLEELSSNNTPDFSEVEWKVVDAETAKGIIDYGSIEAVKYLLAGEVLEIPEQTQLSRLYRWLNRKGFTLRRRKIGNGKLIIWTVPRNEETTLES